MTRAWLAVTAIEPCSICGKPDWCSRSSDGSMDICRRMDRGDGRARKDKGGADYWVYRVDGTVSGQTHDARTDTAPPKAKRSNDVELDRVYSALLARCPISDAHRQSLRDRGLSDQRVAEGSYGTLQIKARSRVAKSLLQLFGQDLLVRVPGFGWKNGSSGPYFTVFGAAGMMIPVRSADGLIVAVKIRADEAPKGSRYTYISSARHGGPGPGAPDHYPLGWQNLRGPVRITEGELKADVATAKSGTATIGVAGIGRLPGLVATIGSLSRSIVLAPDADATTNAHVARSVHEAISRLRAQELDYAVETWPHTSGKGIDDALAAGAIIQELKGEALLGYEAQLRSVAEISDCEEDCTEPADVSTSHGLIPLGKRDPRSGRLVLSPKRTLPTAQVFVRDHCMHPEGRLLHSYGGELIFWWENRFVRIEEDQLSSELLPWLHRALRYVKNKDGAFELVDFESNPATVKAALDSIALHCFLPADKAAPSWIGSSEGRPCADEILSCRSSSIHIPTGEIMKPSPALFAFNALEFDWNPSAPAPARWIAFLEQLFPGDPASVALLQEYFGYCLLADTRHQKALLMVGPRRSGKGTIGRVLRKLVGESNVASPTVASLAQNFGLQPLVGKTVAIVSDARFSGDNITSVVERLLCVIGEDAITIDRKYLVPITQKLAVRFVFMTNELPRFADSSAALAGRFLILQLRRSFYGQENTRLTEELLEELPGILLWAIEGWKRLRARGRFAEPESSQEAKRELEELSSPVGAFVRDRCVLGPHFRVPVATLHEAWTDWCKANGSAHVSNRQTFGRDLRAAFPEIRTRRNADDTRFFEGVALADRFEPPHTAATVPTAAIAGARGTSGAQASESFASATTQERQCRPSRRSAAVDGGDASPEFPADLLSELDAIGEDFAREGGGS